MASEADLRERIPCVHTGSYSDKHSGRTIKFCVTKDDNGEWTTRAYARDAREKLKFVDAPNSWQREWDARRHRVKKAKGRVKSLMDKLDFPIVGCPVCGADSSHTHKVTNRSVVEAAHGNLPDYEKARDHPVYWCDECSVNFKSTGDYNYTSRAIYADVFDREAPSAGISRHFSMRQDRKKGKLMETADKYQEDLTQFHEDLLAVREYVQQHEGVEFDYL